MGYSADYLTCVNAANAGSTTLSSCQKSEFKRQEDRMDSLFKISLNLYAEKEQKLQKKNQKLWVKQRD